MTKKVRAVQNVKSGIEPTASAQDPEVVLLE
jgi:hypothetical protein